MKQEACQREYDVLAAAKSGGLSGELLAHSIGCRECEEALMVVREMSPLAALSPAQSFPAYRLMWMKARYTQRQQRLSILDLVWMISLAILGVVIFCGIIVWRFPALFPGLSRLVQSNLPPCGNGLYATIPFVGLVICLTLLWLITRDRFFAEQ
jgi:hypothetical protein